MSTNWLGAKVYSIELNPITGFLVYVCVQFLVLSRRVCGNKLVRGKKCSIPSLEFWFMLLNAFFIIEN